MESALLDKLGERLSGRMVPADGLETGAPAVRGGLGGELGVGDQPAAGELVFVFEVLETAVDVEGDFNGEFEVGVGVVFAFDKDFLAVFFG